MKRAILGLLVAAVVTGCGSSCPYPDTIVYWTFTDAAGRATTDCATAGVTYIRIFINGTPQVDPNGNADLRCSDYGQGALFPPSVRGAVQLQVEGYASDDATLLYMDQQDVNIAACGETVIESNLAAVQGSLTLNLGGFSQCPSQGYVWYSLTDVTNPQQPLSYSVIDGRSGAQVVTSVPCAGAVSFPGVPFGNYQLDWIQIVVPTNDAQQPYAAIWQKCAPTTIQHNGNDTVPVTLTAAATTCPGT